jgi:hypothetical protein
LVKTQFSTKIKKVKIDNVGEFVNKDLTIFLEIKGIIHDLLLPYIYKSKTLSIPMNYTIIIMVLLMTLDYTNVLLHILWAEVASIVIYIKYYLAYSTFQLKKLLYKVLFGDKPSIKYLYPFEAK